jgi:hypothetical protein
MVWATKYLRPYLYGRHFKIVTDHKPLTWIMNLKDPGSGLLRWRIHLEESDYEKTYKRGSNNTNADALSRMAVLLLKLRSVQSWMRRPKSKFCMNSILHHWEGTGA